MLDKAFEALSKLDYESDDLQEVAQIDDAIIATQGDKAGRKDLEERLLAVVQGSGTRNGKDYACRKLKIVGTEASVPVLAKMLGDDKMSHMARYALESMPVDAAGAALRDALGSLSGELKAGVIGSLGVRQDNGAVATLATLIKDSDAVVARSAALALGAIRSKDAAKALANAKPNPAAISAAIDSSLSCAESLLAGGDKLGAMSIYKELSKGDQPKHVKLAATRGILACAKS